LAYLTAEKVVAPVAYFALSGRPAIQRQSTSTAPSTIHGVHPGQPNGPTGGSGDPVRTMRILVKTANFRVLPTPARAERSWPACLPSGRTGIFDLPRGTMSVCLAAQKQKCVNFDNIIFQSILTIMHSILPT